MNPDFKNNKLIPAIIQEYRTKKVLMLAYVNEESYEYMLKNKQTCFYSRSRQELWHKGETSGNIQYIKSMYMDCDNDTLLIFVEQSGSGACHTGNYSCFYNEIMADETVGEEKGILNEIYNQIQDRSINPKEKSYTNYLLNEGIDKICKKIGEEATETVIAAKNADKEEIIGEISDLIYHTLVLLFKSNVKLQDIENKLIERHKKQGNKKEKNVRGEY